MSILGDIARGVGESLPFVGGSIRGMNQLSDQYDRYNAATSKPKTGNNPAAPNWVTGNQKSSIPGMVTAPADANIASTFRGSAELEAANRQYAAVMEQIAAMPKLLQYDTNSAWQNAQNKAASTVNPVYVDKMNNFLLEQKNYLSQATASATAGKTAADTSLAQTQQDIGTNKVRTAEDTATAIAQNQAGESAWATSEGATNNAAEEAARLATGDQGIMGRGAGALGEAKITRNLESGQQTEAYKQDRETKKLLETRTFADLETKGARVVQQTATEKANLDRQLDDFIVNQGTALTEKQAALETARNIDLRSTTRDEYNNSLSAWLADQASAGAREQDLTFTNNWYSR